MKVTIGRKGLRESFQEDFPATVPCSRPGCGGTARHAFTAHEGGPEDAPHVSRFHPGDGGQWPHDACCVAVYFCDHSLDHVEAILNQA